MRAIPQHFCDKVASKRGATSSVPNLFLVGFGDVSPQGRGDEKKKRRRKGNEGQRKKEYI